MLKTADLLKFVSKHPNLASMGPKEHRLATSSAKHAYKQVRKNTKDYGLTSPEPLSRREEFDYIKSCEKQALFLSERFGDRRAEASTTVPHAGDSQHLLHLSKHKIDSCIRI